MQDFSKLSVLTVDDNRQMMNIVSTILKSFGVGQVYECTEASEAYSALKGAVVDVLITDLRMKPVDGLELVRRIRTSEDSPNPYIPIIVLSAYTEMSQVIAARDAGVTEFLAKPVTAEALYKRLNAVVARPRVFVRAGHFFGPDRRRRKDPPPGAERRGDAEMDRSLSQDEIEALMNE